MNQRQLSCFCDRGVMQTRRNWLRMVGAGMAGASMSRWMPTLAADAVGNRERRRACILLWMNGGPSQLDTFDLKPDHENGGDLRPIETSVPGIRISEHLPRLAKLADHMAIVNSMSTKEGDHSRGAYLMRTGYPSQGPIQYPTIGSLYSNELAAGERELPDFVSIAPERVFSADAYSPGFLGPARAPLIVGESRGRAAANGPYGEALEVANLSLPSNVDVPQHDARLTLANGIDQGFRATRPDASVQSHRTAYEQAVRMMRSTSIEAFDLEQEPAALREQYGRHQFGQGCLLARRLVERGVPFVEVSLNRSDPQNGSNWDTHGDNARHVRQLNQILDPAWATLMTDLADRGLLETTTILWMGEFGRTPIINRNAGRDHFPVAWSTVLAGGGIRGGQTIGNTTVDGMEVADRPVSVQDLLATVVAALGIDPMKQNISNVGRPIRIVDPTAQPITEALA